MSSTNLIDFHIMLDTCNPNHPIIPKGMEFMLRLFNYNKNFIFNHRSNDSHIYTFGNKNFKVISIKKSNIHWEKKDLKELISELYDNLKEDLSEKHTNLGKALERLYNNIIYKKSENTKLLFIFLDSDPTDDYKKNLQEISKFFNLILIYTDTTHMKSQPIELNIEKNIKQYFINNNEKFHKDNVLFQNYYNLLKLEIYKNRIDYDSLYEEVEIINKKILSNIPSPPKEVTHSIEIGENIQSKDTKESSNHPDSIASILLHLSNFSENLIPELFFFTTDKYKILKGKKLEFKNQADISEKTGLLFNFTEEGIKLEGVPKPNSRGDYFLEIVAGKENYRIPFVIFADPKTLWKVVSPSDQDIKIYNKDFQKVESDIDFHDLKIIGISRRGRSHEQEGKFNEDGFSIEKITNDVLAVVVSDGAGSASLSRLGSDLICRMTIDFFKSLSPNFFKKLSETNLEEIKNQDILPKFLELGIYIHNNLLSSAESELSIKEALKMNLLKKDNINLKSLSGTLLSTLVVKTKSGYYLYNFSIGDGGIACRLGNEIKILNYADHGVSAGETRFVTTKSLFQKENLQELYNRIKILEVKDKIDFFSMTDGVLDPKFINDDNFSKPEYWQRFIDSLPKKLDKKEYLEWIHFYESGYHDDRTLVRITNN